MIQETTTDSVRIDRELLDKIRIIAKTKGQTISGFINVNLNKVVDRQWQKHSVIEKPKKHSI
jgi:predicted transcriptional regulator